MIILTKEAWIEHNKDLENGLITEFIEDLKHEKDFWHPKGNYRTCERLIEKWEKKLG